LAQLLTTRATHRRAAVGSAVITDVMSPAPRDIWRGVLRDDPGATALQTPEYFAAVLTATRGRDASRVYQLSDGRQLVLPLVQERSVAGLRVESAYPGGYGHGGMLATGGLLEDDVSMVVRDLRSEAISVRIGGAHHTADAWSAGLLPGVVDEGRRVDVIDLAGGFEALKAERFSPKVRQRIRKAQRDGVEIERDTTGRLVPVFHDIYRGWVERWIPRSGLPPVLARRMALREEPLHKFETVAAEIGEDCRVFVAWHRGRPVAAGITLVHGQHAIGWRSYSIKELAAPVSANIFNQVACIEDASRSGCRWFDLGQSGGVASLQDYKSSLGASPRSVVDLRIEPAGLARLRAARGRAEGVLARALTRSPAGPTSGQPTL
jgi:hypothetical protein